MPKTDFRKPLGNFGEKVAGDFLAGKGYRLVEKNYIIAGGQIDLIMYSPIGNLIFVEVKTRRAARGYMAECRLSRRQIHALTRAARHYLSDHPLPPVTWQFDLIWIDLNRSGNTVTAKIKHFQNILEL